MSGRRIAVIGGGLAGITAALDCAIAGAEVTLLESRGRLGGAAYSFTRDGLAVDNGQHVFLRCCTAYRALLDQLDARELVTLQPRLRIPVLAPGGRRAVLERSQAPAPLHLAGSLMRYSLLTKSERLAVVRAMAALRKIDRDDPAQDARAFGEWLAEHGQSEDAIAAIWELIARPTVNLTVDRASLAQAAQVFQEGLLTDAAAADVGYARVPLSEIHDRAARRKLGQTGVHVQLRRGASTVTAVGRGFRVEISGGPTVAADVVIIAVPPDRARSLVPSGAGIDPRALLALGRSPIVNLHVLYDRPVLDEPFAAGVFSPVQWIFDRTATSGADHGQYLAVSLSAADEELSTSVDQLRERYLPALAELLGHDARVERFFVTREHSATFVAAPGARMLRPPARTALPGLVLAGSWTDTGWPATMEGAVRSGHAAAEEALTTSLPSRRAPVRRPSGARPRPRLEVLAPMELEARALRAGADWARVERIGMGARRAARHAAASVNGGGAPVLLAGFCGAVDERLKPGDLVLADRLLGPGGEQRCADPTILASILRRAGMRVWVGPIASSGRLASGPRRRRLESGGALAVDMESAAVASCLSQRQLVVLRAVLDTPRDELYRPVRSARALVRAWRSLRQASATLEPWTRALGPRELILASPRASCAGVERAVEIVERVLAESGPPVYVRKQIVHNSHVIADLEARGVVFVDEVDEVPPDATVIFSAHGVSPEVRDRARARRLEVIDATCPLVSKVHAEARRFSARGYDIVLVGHEGHEEVEGTFGEAPERTRVIATSEEAEQIEVDDPSRVAYLTQTTLAVDDTAEVIATLKRRFPDLAGPRSSDICYATQNRQDAVRAVARESDLVLVIGSRNSSNSRRLVEVAERAGTPALLIENGGEIPVSRLEGVRRIGVTAGASAPDKLVRELIDALSGLGEITVSERAVASEDVQFKLPVEVR